MKQDFFTLQIDVAGKSLTDISDTLQTEVSQRGFNNGLLTLWCLHTGASLLVQANADPDVTADILAFFDKLAPKDPGRYQHRPDQDDNAPSHLRALLTQTQVSLPIENGQLPLGKVQSLYLAEHRDRGRTRTLKAHFIGL